MNIGFTGNRKGMSENQFDAFVNVIHTLMRTSDTPNEFHHGDCEGSDSNAHEIIEALRTEYDYDIKIVVHPPWDEKARAFCKIKETDELRHPGPYLMRNHDIVDDCDIMIACPSSVKEVLRSGTWATVRYTRESSKSLMLLFPSGAQVLEEGK